MEDALTDVGDASSMVAAPPRRRMAIDQYQWGRAALGFAEISVEEHEAWAARLGSGAAAEILLLAIARKCGNNRKVMS